MEKLSDTYWYAEDYNIYFYYSPDSENNVYVFDGEASINGESYKYTFDISSAEDTNDGYGYGYTIYKNSLNDDDALYLFYDKDHDVLTNYYDLELSREYRSRGDEIKWGIINWARKAWSYIWRY